MMQKLIALDQFINAWLFGGWADETISSRAYRNSAQGNKKWDRFMRAIDAMFFWQPRHCETSYKREQARMQLPPIYRGPVA